jgi:DNA polymerase III delta prime subunit
MTERVLNKLKQSIQEAEALYHRLVLLAGKTGSGKTGILKCVANDFDTAVININLGVSMELLELTSRQRSLKLQGILDQITSKTQSPVILDNLEILFDKDLKQDPLRLLQGLSRNRTVVASWNGLFNGNKLLYAETGHPEYHSYESVDALIVNMDETVMIDSTKTIKEAGRS